MVKDVSCRSHSIIFLGGALGRDWPCEEAIGSGGECEAEDDGHKKVVISELEVGPVGFANPGGGWMVGSLYLVLNRYHHRLS